MGAAAKIGEISKERGIALKELSRMVNIPYTTLYNAVKRDSKMDFETVQRIATALGCSLSDFYPDGFFCADYEAANEQEEKERADVISEVFSNSAQKLQEAVSSAKEQRDKVRRSLLSQYTETLADLNDYGAQAAVLAAISIMGDDVTPAGVVVDVAMHDLRKVEDITNMLNLITQIPAYQRTTAAPQDAPAEPDDKEPAEK